MLKSFFFSSFFCSLYAREETEANSKQRRKRTKEDNGSQLHILTTGSSEAFLTSYYIRDRDICFCHFDPFVVLCHLDNLNCRKNNWFVKGVSQSRDKGNGHAWAESLWDSSHRPPSTTVEKSSWKRNKELIIFLTPAQVIKIVIPIKCFSFDPHNDRSLSLFLLCPVRIEGMLMGKRIKRKLKNSFLFLIVHSFQVQIESC